MKFCIYCIFLFQQSLHIVDITHKSGGYKINFGTSIFFFLAEEGGSPL